MIEPHVIAEVWRERRTRADETRQRLDDVTSAYNGDDIVDIADLYRGAKPAAANLVFANINQHAMRIAAPTPMLHVPPLRPGFKGSETKAKDRRRVFYGWMELNDFAQLRLQRAMWLIAWLGAPVLVRPDAVSGHPRWELRDPRRFYPSDAALRPRDAVSTTSRTFGWLKANYPDAAPALDALHKDGRDGWTDDHRVTVLEFWDAAECQLIAVGDSDDPSSVMTGQRLRPEQRACVLDAYPNLAGVTPVTCPRPVSLDPDDPRSQFDGMLGSFKMRARLLALSYLAVEKGVFPDTWLEGRQNEEPEIRQQPDPRQGVTGIAVGGQVRREPPDPQYGTGLMLDRLEAEERQSGSAPPEFGGLGATNVRTGRRGGQVLGAAIDFYIQTAQLRFAESLRVELDTAIRVDLGYFGGREKDLWVTHKGASGPVRYRPTELWESSEVRVDYPFAGVDLSNVTLEAGQLVGLEALSRESLMDLHPLVTDVEREKDRIAADRLERVFWAVAEQQGSDPASGINLSMLTRLRELILSDRLEWWEAFQKLQSEAQAAQAEQMAGQVDPLAAAMMPGVDGGAVPGGPVAPPEQTMPGMQELGSMLMATRGPRMSVRGEVPVG